MSSMLSSYQQERMENDFNCVKIEYADGENISMSFPQCLGFIEPFVRDKSEKLARLMFILRIDLKIRYLGSNGTSISILNKYGEDVDQNLILEEAFAVAAHFKVNEQSFPIYMSRFFIETIEMISRPLQNIPIFPRLTPAYLNLNNFNFEWYRVSDEKEFFLSNNKSYTPDAKDIGFKIKLVIKSKNLSKFNTECTHLKEHQSFFVVEAHSVEFLYETRYLGFQRPNYIRIVSYNILAEKYTLTDYSRGQCYPQVPGLYLSNSYRQLLIMQELVHYSGHIIGLQECEYSQFGNFLYPHLKEKGYEGLICCKDIHVPEGSATFYNTQRFSYVCSYDNRISDLLNMKEFEKLLSYLYSSKTGSDFLFMLSELKHIVQVTLLYDLLCDCNVLVVNTHIHFKLGGDNIRLVQTMLILHYVYLLRLRIVEEYQNQKEPAIIILGDFNSLPKDPAIELILKKFVSSDKFGESEHSFSIFSPLSLFCASGFWPASHWTAQFHGLLDYIFVDGKSFDRNVISSPICIEEVMKYNYLPAPHVPSDHVPLICDVNYKST